MAQSKVGMDVLLRLDNVQAHRQSVQTFSEHWSTLVYLKTHCFQIFDQI